MRFMSFKLSSFILILVLVFSFDSAVFANGPYKTGKQILAENPEIAGKENGFFVKVPVDYHDKSQGFTEVYAHFRKPFDTNLPTYVLFTGGPGQDSHFPSGGKADMYADIGYNFLLFDQRGIAFSRPEKEALWLSPDFHSTENNARDLEEIRKFLNIEKISVYGASYGTTPATVYGHLFPKSTRSVVLEGVVYDGFDITPQVDDFLPKVIQRYFDSLNPTLKEKLNRISNDTNMPRMWFPAYVQSFLTYSGTESLPVLTQMLETAANAEDEKFRDEFNKAQAAVNKGAVPPKNLFEDHVNTLLLVKEFGMSRTDIFNQLILENGKIKRQVNGYASMYVSGAKNLGMPIDKKSTYSAVNYPLEVPTYYLNGTRDGATIPPWAIKHWKNVPQGEAYLLLLKGGGHMPGGQILKFDLDKNGEAGPQSKVFFKSIFKKMLDAAPISKNEIEDWNKTGVSKIAFTSKKPSQLKCQNVFN